jgi:hypothetical protein
VTARAVTIISRLSNLVLLKLVNVLVLEWERILTTAIKAI